MCFRAFGSKRLCEITRADVQCFVAEKRNRGYSGSYIHGMRTTLGKALQSAVEWGYIEQNAARGVNIGSREPKTERLYLSAMEAVKLISNLGEPVRTVVLMAVLTGLRIGEVLALRWKHIDFLREAIQIRGTVSEGRFGTPKTKAAGATFRSAARSAKRCLLSAGARGKPEPMISSSRPENKHL